MTTVVLGQAFEKSVKIIRDAGIKVLANFIVGLPHDTKETIDATFKMALNLEAEFSNFYPCMALPGSDLYLSAKKNGVSLPEDYSGYGFLAYDCVPLPTETLSAQEVLKLRDMGFEKYVSDPNYQMLFKQNFGENALNSLNELFRVKLKRKLLE